MTLPTPEMIEAAKAKGRELVGNQPGALVEAFADVAAAGAAAALALLPGETQQLKWFDGAPPHPWDKEWFIAQTTYGDKVVLTALPEEFTYDYKTADDTYIKRDKIKRWMQFPDSAYVEYAPAEPAASPAPLPVAVKIKPLEWEKGKQSNWTVWRAKGLGVTYECAAKVYNEGWMWGTREGDTNFDAADEDEAKAAAQSHYENTIRSALSSPVGGTETEEPFVLGYDAGLKQGTDDVLATTRQAIAKSLAVLKIYQAGSMASRDEIEDAINAIELNNLGSPPTPASDIAALRGENERLRAIALDIQSQYIKQDAAIKVLKRIEHWAQSRCPCHEETPNPCPLCGASVENLEACKSVESIFPRDLLADLRSALQHVAKGERG